LPEPPFTTYGTEGVFSVFTSDAQYDGNTYSIDIKCHSQVSNQDPIVQSFAITFIRNENSSSDASDLSECANDIISFNTELIDYELPVSEFPTDIVFTPLITQDVEGCPI